MGSDVSTMKDRTADTPTEKAAPEEVFTVRKADYIFHTKTSSRKE